MDSINDLFMSTKTHIYFAPFRYNMFLCDNETHVMHLAIYTTGGDTNNYTAFLEHFECRMRCAIFV